MTIDRLTVLIVDDEPPARRLIRRMLKDDGEVEVLGECGNGRAAVAMINELRPDLVFLDVQMPEMDGFAVLENLAPDCLPAIVFTTAYERYAIRAFELHALDYLLKPFDQVRFKKTLSHAQHRLRNRQAEGERQQIAALIENVKTQPAYLSRLIIKSQGHLMFLHTADIDWVEADDKYVNLHAGKTSRMVRQTLSAMEAQLDPQKFLRIHRSAIVNVDRIKELHALFAGEHVVILENGTRLTLSRNYKQRLFELLGKPL
jgi:two-component system LytT family response regulator